MTRKKKVSPVMTAEEVAVLAAKRKLAKQTAIIISLATVCFIWGAVLQGYNIIPGYVVKSTALAGGIVMPFFLKQRPGITGLEWAGGLVIYCVFGLSVGFFSLFAVNYYAPLKSAEIVQLPILKTGVTYNRRKAAYPYCIVRYNGIEKSISFASQYMNMVPKATMVELEIKKGVLGYYVITDKDLIY